VFSVDFQTVAKYPLVVIVGFLASWVLTRLSIRACPSLGFVDMPDARRIHTHPIPRCGVSVFLGFHLACAAVFLVPWRHFNGQLTAEWWVNMLPLSATLLAIGLLDDKRGLSPGSKLLAQIVLALLAFAADIRVGRLLGADLPLAADVGLTVLWFVAIINAFNLIDGLDGLAAGLAAVGSIGMAGSFLFRHMPRDALVLLGLAGACLGFLRYNAHPARIFLGDSGSMFLGFTLAAVALATGAKGTALATIGVPLLAVGVPLFDTMLAIWRRGARRFIAIREGGADNPQMFKADLEHIHHRLLRKGLTQREVASWMHLAAALLVAVGLLSMVYRSHAVGIFILAFVVGSYVAVRHLAHVELWDSGRLLVTGLSRPPRKAVAVLLYPLFDFLALCAALAVAVHFSTPAMAAARFKLLWFDQIPVWVGVPFLSLFTARTYQRVWSRARASEYALLAVTLAAGIVAAVGLALTTGLYTHPLAVAVMNLGNATDTTVVMGHLVPRALTLQVIVYATVSALLVVGLRILPRTVQDVMVWTCPCKEMAGHPPPRALVCGSGIGCTLFLMRRNSCFMDRSHCFQIVGVLDSDRNLHGRFIQGYRVLGGPEDLSRVLDRYRVEQIVVTDRLDADGAILFDIARQRHVPVLEWKTQLEPLAAARLENAPPAAADRDL
jgi:UDP-GlcNAc:undecaprenyl-phosphate GlcNAc-1-phosphate transferase